MLKRFKANRRGAWKANNYVRLADLIEPIAVIECKNVPIDDTAIFESQVKPFINAFSAVDEGTDVNDGTENADAQGQFVFVIRDEGWKISITNFIVWGQRVFKVLGCQRVKGLTPFLEIATSPYGTVTSCNFTLVDELTVPAAGATHTEEATNPFWTD